MSDNHRFNSASHNDPHVFGACRPGYYSVHALEEEVARWIGDMEENGIVRVCCLLGQDELEGYDDLLGTYQEAFGSDHFLHSPVTDYTTVDARQFQDEILPFLRQAEVENERVVVHCSAGMGRTGQVLALWLATERGFELNEAISEVEEQCRNPLEAATRSDLQSILNTTSSGNHATD